MKLLKAAVLTLAIAGLAACVGCAEKPTSESTSTETTTATPGKSPKESGSTAAKKKDPFATEKASGDQFDDF